MTDQGHRGKLSTCFLSIPIPDSLIYQIVELQQKLERYPELSLEYPTKFHISLAYLGRIPEDYQRLVVKRTKTLINSLSPFQLSLGHIDYFYDQDVVWLAVYDDEDHSLDHLQRQIVKDLNQFDFSLSTKKFTPHVTIARLKRVKTDHRRKFILSQLAEHETPEFTPFTVNQIQLMQSNNRRVIDATHYTVFKSVFFSE